MFRVKNLDESSRFYSEALGLKQAWRDDEHHMIGFVFPESDAEIVIHTLEDIPNPDFSFLVDDVEALVKEFRSQGYAVLREPFEVRPGKFAVLADPDGNAINIIDLSKFEGKPKY